MSYRAVKHLFTGSTTPITSYDATKTNLGTLMIQKTGSTATDKWAGPLPVAIATPMQEVVDTVGSVSVTTTAVTGNGTNFTASMVGMVIGFGSTDPAKVTAWYSITVRGSATSLTISPSIGATPIVSGTAYVIVYNTPMMYPHAITYSPTIDWVFMIENLATAVAPREICMYEYNKTTGVYTWKGFIIATLTSATTHTLRGFRALRYLHTTGTVQVSGTAVTGSGTKFQDEGVAVGARIGFGSTDPTQISSWYVISAIGGEASITLATSAGTVNAGSSYVIEELRFGITATNATAANGGLHLVKGINYSDFVPTGTTISAATTTDNIKAVYWLSDAGTTGNVVTNQSPCGLAVAPEVNKGLHYAYVIDGGTTTIRIYRYNLRATGTITSGKMTMSIAYYTTGTVEVSGTAVTGTGTTFTASMVGMKIGFNTTSPATVATWYTIESFTDATHITLSSSAGTIGAGAVYIIDSADVISTAPQLVTGTIVGLNNGRIGTLNHGPGVGELSIYFVTTTRLYRAAISKIFAGNLGWISDNRPEIPPGSVSTFPATNALSSVEISDSIDRLIVLTSGATAFKHYVTRYPEVAGEQFNRFFGLDDKQQDQSIADPNAPIHFNTASQATSVWSENGIAHIVKHGATAALCQMYALPLGAHWSYADSTNQRVITPEIATPDCSSFRRMLTSVVDHLGSEEFRIPTASIFSFYRTSGIDDNTGSWTQLPEDGDLSGLSPSTSIQFMFEFTTISLLCVPGRIMSLAVLYDDFSTDAHYQPSSGKTVEASKQFAWRFSTAFGSTVPTLRIRLYDAVTGGLLVDDDSVTQEGTWEKTTDDGANWTSYNTTDKANETTYIRFTPDTLPDNIKIRALLTQN